MAYAFVECGEDQIIFNHHAEQVRICNLLVTVQTPEKGLGQRAPVVNARVVVVARMAFDLLQEPRGKSVMRMSLKEAGDQHIYIDQVKGFSQDRPQTLPSPFQR